MGFYFFVRTRASGGILRGPSGKIEQAIASEGMLTCKEVERQLIELAEREGVPRDERHIQIFEEES